MDLIWIWFGFLKNFLRIWIFTIFQRFDLKIKIVQVIWFGNLVSPNATNGSVEPDFCRWQKVPSLYKHFFFFFLGISRGGLAIVFCSWNSIIGPIWNNFSHREQNLKSGCPPLPLKIFFFYWRTFFEKDRWVLEPTASVKILYTTLENLF